jgi:hypothetical protein
MSIEIWDWGLGYIYLWDVLIAWKWLGAYSIDFTQTSDWWTLPSWVSRDSNWLYASWTWSDYLCVAPSSIYGKTPKKIKIVYNKVNASSWTWLYENKSSGAYTILLPKQYNGTNLNYISAEYNSSSLWSANLWSNPTWTVEWTMDIDTSTTNWTVAHSITGVSSQTDTSWALKNIWTNQNLTIRIVNWQGWTWSIYIKSFEVEYQ